MSLRGVQARRGARRWWAPTHGASAAAWVQGGGRSRRRNYQSRLSRGRAVTYHAHAHAACSRRSMSSERCFGARAPPAAPPAAAPPPPPARVERSRPRPGSWPAEVLRRAKRGGSFTVTDAPRRERRHERAATATSSAHRADVSGLRAALLVEATSRSALRPTPLARRTSSVGGALGASARRRPRPFVPQARRATRAAAEPRTGTPPSLAAAPAPIARHRTAARAAPARRLRTTSARGIAAAAWVRACSGGRAFAVRACLSSDVVPAELRRGAAICAARGGRRSLRGAAPPIVDRVRRRAARPAWARDGSRRALATADVDRSRG